MSREALDDAIEAVERARDATVDTARQDRLDQLASHLRTHANREPTPALGTLDRVQTKLRTIHADTEEEAVADAIDEAREHILAFLGTLDDRGMQQHQ